MKTLVEIQAGLMPILKACMIAANRERGLIGLNDAMSKIQLAVLWLKESEITSSSETDITMEMALHEKPLDSRPEVVIPPLPTMMGTGDYIKFAFNNLNSLKDDIGPWKVHNQNPKAVNELDQAYNNLQEALFSIRISANQYEQTTR